MHLSYIILVVVGISFVNCFPATDDDFVGIKLRIGEEFSLKNINYLFKSERDDALEFLNEKRDLDVLKRLLYTGKEQRREAKEN